MGLVRIGYPRGSQCSSALMGGESFQNYGGVKMKITWERDPYVV